MAFLSFSVHRKVNKNFETVGVLYDFPNGGKSRAFIEEIDTLFNKRLPPSRLIIVCEEGRELLIEQDFKSIEKIADPRLRTTEDVQVLPYDGRGRLLPNKIVILRISDDPWILCDKDLYDITKAGTEELIRKSGVILDAPPGYEFRKPSQDSNSVFVRSGNLIRELPALALTNHLLMRRFPPNVEVLFIDSFTILSIALAFQQARKDQNAAGAVDVIVPRIENFHSYDIEDDFLFSPHVNYGILISASSSGNLAAKLVDRHGATRDRITHLIGHSSNRNLANDCLIFTYQPPSSHKEDFSFLKEISIRGEAFIAAHSKSLLVQITKKHFCEKFGEILVDQWYQDALAIRLYASGHESHCTFSLEGCASFGGVAYGKWFRSECDYSLPSNVSWILAVDEKRGLALAQRMQNRFKKLLGRTVPIRRLALLDRMDEPPKGSKDDTIIICCGETARGNEMLTASRFLRTVKHAHRHYVCPHIFPESRDSLARLERNLCVSGSGRDFGFSSFISEPVGSVGIHDSWSNELVLLERGFAAGIQDQLNKALKRSIIQRKAILNGGLLAANSVFLPTVQGNDLELRPDSILFPKGYKRIPQTVVYYRVANGLQCARDHKTSKDKKLDSSLCFHGNPFVASILDPDMFSRYNDGVIQAAILRSCTADEMNFAADSESSRQMGDIICELVKRRNRKSGEAVLEFILALRMRRIRLLKDDFLRAEEQIKKAADLRIFWALINAEPEL
jgi:hypothetical protein